MADASSVELQEIGPAENSVRRKLGNAKHVEEQVLIDIAKAFDILDFNDDKSIDRDEFKKSIARLDLHRPKGAADGWKDDVFDKFDVDNKGSVCYNEFCFAVAQTVFTYRTDGREMTAIEVLQEVLEATQEAQTAAKEEVEALGDGAKGEFEVEKQRQELANKAEVTVLHEKTSDDEWYDSKGALLCLALFPCYLCCTPFACAHAGDGKHLHGLPAVVKYVTTCKEAPVVYTWTFQCYHYKTVTTGAGKNKRTKRVRVNTRRGSTSGTLMSTDQSPTFVPNMRRRNLALASELQTTFTPSFRSVYDRQRDMYWSVNKTDKHQDTHETLEIKPMIAAARCEWADDDLPDPCYANLCCMCLSTITWTASCWLYKMRQFQCSDTYTFNKLASGFVHKLGLTQDQQFQ